MFKYIIILKWSKCNNFLKWRKCNNFFKQLIKGNVKYTKSLTFLYLLSLFHFILRNYILTQDRWKLLHDLIFTRVQHYVDVWLFNKTSIVNLKDFIVETINYLGWETNLSIRPPRFFEHCLEVSINTNQWERLCWKTVYSMILANNNAKWISSQQVACGSAKFGLLGREHLHHLSQVILLKMTFQLICQVVEKNFSFLLI